MNQSLRNKPHRTWVKKNFFKKSMRELEQQISAFFSSYFFIVIVLVWCWESWMKQKKIHSAHVLLFSPLYLLHCFSHAPRHRHKIWWRRHDFRLLACDATWETLKKPRLKEYKNVKRKIIICCCLWLWLWLFYKARASFLMIEIERRFWGVVLVTKNQIFKFYLFFFYTTAHESERFYFLLCILNKYIFSTHSFKF